MNVGTVQALWRYPVKSMAGESVETAFVGFPGLFGDRAAAFVDEQGPQVFPWLTGRADARMLLYRPRFRHPERAGAPRNGAEAVTTGSGLTPLPAMPEDLEIDVTTPDGRVLGLDDPALAAALAGQRRLRLVRSERAMTDCRPVSLFSTATVAALSAEVGVAIDPRRFRANIYLDLGDSPGFAEDEFVGRSLRIGERVVISVVGRDPRCRMITIDPDTAETTPALLEAVASGHQSMAGVYAAVVAEGFVSRGDEVALLD